MNWGAKITMVLVAFVLGIGSMVYICVKQTDIQLVTKDYYEQEIRFQEVIDKEKNYAELIIKPAIKENQENEQLILDFSKMERRNLISGKIFFFRPSQSNVDFYLDIDLDEEGYQYIDQSKLLAGKWLIKLDWTDGSLAYYHEQTIWLQ